MCNVNMAGRGKMPRLGGAVEVRNVCVIADSNTSWM